MDLNAFVDALLNATLTNHQNAGSVGLGISTAAATETITALLNSVSLRYTESVRSAMMVICF